MYLNTLKGVKISKITNYKSKDLAALLGISVKTLQRWDREEIIVDQCIEDYGSGLNYNRKKWNKLLDEVRLHGLCKYKKQIERDGEIAKELQNGDQPIRRTESQDL